MMQQPHQEDEGLWTMSPPGLEDFHAFNHEDFYEASPPESTMGYSGAYLSPLSRSGTRTTSVSTSVTEDEGIGMSPSMLSSSASASLSPESQMDFLPVPSILNPSNNLEAEASKGKSSSRPALADTDDDLHCFVCKEKAGRHSYYGGHVCASCRAFFRRAVQSKYYEIFFCSKGENCEINLKTRRSCQYCRFKKCLASGMRVAWVLPDGERNKRFNKLEKTQYRNSLSIREIMPQQFGLSPEETVALTQMVSYAQPNYSNCFDKHEGFFRVIAEVAYSGRPMKHEIHQQFAQQCLYFTEQMLLGMSEMKSLTVNDKRELVRANTPLVSLLKEAYSLDVPGYGLMGSIEEVTRSGQFPSFNDLKQCLDSIGEDKKPVLSYHQVYTSPWAASYEDEQRHYELSQKVKQWTMLDASNKPDNVLTTLGRFVLALNTDFVGSQLERRDEAEKLQIHFINLLRKYLRMRYGKNREAAADAKLAEGLMVIAHTREMAEIMTRRLPV